MTRILLIVAILLLAACATNPAYDEGMALIQAGRTEEGLGKLEEAAQREPSNQQYRQAYFRQREIALQRQLAFAEAARQQGQWEAAEAAYKRMLSVDRQNVRARAGLESLEGDRQRRAEQVARREQERTESVPALSLSSRIVGALAQPMKIDFRDATLRQIFDVVSKSTGVDIIFDRGVRLDQRATVLVRNSSIDDVLRYLLVTNQLERRILADNLLLIYPNTAAKRGDYQELVAKTLFVSNADVKTIASMIRTVVKTKDLHIDEKLNAIVMRDTPDAIRMAERLAANLDVAEAEVMLEVEVLEVGSSDLTELGIRYPDQISASLIGAAGTAGTLTLPEWRSRDASLVRLSFTNPLFALNFRETIGRTNLLANPRIRVKNKGKAKVHIGDKVPVITTTSNATGFVSESVTYLDVGLKLDVEPVISLEDDVAMAIGLEVSNIVREVRSPAGALTYQVGTRNAATSLRLKDGETQVLAGLISDEDRKAVNQLPGLGSLPVIGRLFGNHLDNGSKTEIVLLITPRVVRNLARPAQRFAEFSSGTETSIGTPPMTLRPVALTGEAVGTNALALASPSSASSKPMPIVETRLQLSAPPSVAPGQTVTVSVAMETGAAVRGGLLDFAFDAAKLRFVGAEAGAALRSADSAATLRASAPAGLGRLSLNFASKGDLPGRGDVARLSFQVLEAAAGESAIRLEAASLTSAAGEVMTIHAPPPVRLSFAR